MKPIDIVSSTYDTNSLLAKVSGHYHIIDRQSKQFPAGTRRILWYYRRRFSCRDIAYIENISPSQVLRALHRTEELSGVKIIRKRTVQTKTANLFMKKLRRKRNLKPVKYIRQCKYCDEIYRAVCKFSRVCPVCVAARKTKAVIKSVRTRKNTVPVTELFKSVIKKEVIPCQEQ